MQTLLFTLAPRNPNVNGIYYDEKSYEKAIKEFVKKNPPIFDRYNNDTLYYKSDSHVIIGTIEDYQYVNNDIELMRVNIDDQLQFITPDDYVIGFKLSTTGTIYDYVLNTDRYIIDEILYATFINKEFLK